MTEQPVTGRFPGNVSTEEVAGLYRGLLSVPSGARFFSADLHVHTPASKDYKEKRYTDDQTQDRRYLDLLRKSKELGLDIVAVTDHNTVEGYKEIKGLLHPRSARDEFAGVAVLLGVEITVEAGRYVHLTAYFDEGTPVQDVERLLIRIGIDRPGDGHDWAKAVKLDQLIRIINDMGGLAIPAHVDSTAGILEEMKRGLPLARILTMPEVIAVGITKSKTIAYLENVFREDANYKRSEPMTYVTGSDAHALSKIESIGKNGQREVVDRGLGSLVTYLRMDAPNFAGFKYALRDGAARVRLDPPQPTPHPKILGIAILGGYLGTGNNWCYFRFNDALNCIVGGRGTGKSSILKVVQSLSLALSGRPTNNWHQEIGYAFSKACLFVDVGNSRVCAVAASTSPASVELLGMGNPGVFTPIEGSDDHGWNPNLFAQKQIQAIAARPCAQRELVDSFCVRVEAERWATTSRGLHELKERLGALYSAAKEDARAIGDAKYQIFIANRVLRRIGKLRSGSVSDVIADIDDWKTESQIPPFVAGLLKEEASQEARELVTSLRAAKRGWGGLKPGEPLVPEQSAHQYLTSLRRLGEVAPLERLCLQARHLNGEAIVDSLISLRQTLSREGQLLTSLSDTRQKVYELRKAVALHLSAQIGEKVRINVLAMGDSGSWLDCIRACLNETRWRDAVDLQIPDAAIEQFGTPYLALLAALNKHHPFGGQPDSPANDANGQLRLMMVRSMKSTFLDRLHESERSLDDAVLICLADQGVSRPLGELSLGQRSVAILELALLSVSNMPVVIDQPEDDLDNSYVFGELVQTLRKVKYQRQLILVTHNPNIPIGGDADQVLVMRSDGAHAWAEESGAVDRVAIRHHLLQTLEGGRRAFELRRTRYHAL